MFTGKTWEFCSKSVEIAWVNVEKRHFHAIRRLDNSKIVIVNLVNRREAIKILRNKKKLPELPNKVLELRKRLLGKWNVLFKKKQIESFYRINSKIKIKYYVVNGECKTEISHEEHLVDIFGTEIMQEIDAERNNR